ncbi:uncharacterized protein LOC116291652 [Actinia tenebrosa]|uniref:Uncharacterized protein LOC116291652 n=1 Tax=Actinia tenebrosa TaxID=6105 RepID=A0A6P8HIF8_ACTTE|nr:uncharacterized protein LOC116291652 [Actinia tenebrosa]
MHRATMVKRRLQARLLRSVVFTLKFKGFKRKNFLCLLTAGIVIAFQVVIVSRVLLAKSFSRKSRPVMVNSTLDVHRTRDHQSNFSFTPSVPAMTKPSKFYSHHNLKHFLRKQKDRRIGRMKIKRNQNGIVNVTRINSENGILNSTVPPTLDYRILHEYYPPVNFSVVIPHVVPKFDDKEIFLLVLVSSATAKEPNAERRQAIRKTWGNMKTSLGILSYSSSVKHGFPFKAIVNHSFRLVFLLGKSDNQTLNEEIEEEARTYNDMVVGNFPDVYNNLIIKVYMGFKWAENIKTKFILKGDDDTYVCLPRLMMVLNQAPARFFGGYVMANAVVFREVSNKHAISKMYFSEDYYPPYCGGPFYIFTHNLIPQFLSLTDKFRPFHVEDAYLGILLREMGVQPLFMPGFLLNNWMIETLPNFSPCDWATAIAIGHKFNSSEIEYIHAQLPLHEPSRLTAREWHVCRRKTGAVVSDNMLPTIYGILFSLAMILVYVTAAFLPSQYEYEEEKFIFKRQRRHYYPFIHRSTR